MPIYIGDLLRDTGHLSPAEFGAYHFLIYSAWNCGGLLPGDPEKLRRIARMDFTEWESARDTLIAFFQPVEGGFRHKRIDAELVKAKARIERASGAGKSSAAKRWGNSGLTPSVTPVMIELPVELRSSDNLNMPLHLHLQEEERKKEPPLIPPTVPKPVAKAPKTKPRCQLPDDWRPSLDGFKLAQSQGLDFEQTFLRFRDYHRSKGSLMASWEAAWGTWCRSPYNKPQGGKPSGLDENTRRLIELGAAQPIPDAFTGPTLDGEMFQ
jgi:uncharacterized protein YdaU (DUF1376 family)